jgi:hypothetical protein
MNNNREDEILIKEIEKIIDTNKLKAENLRNILLNQNQNIFNNDLHFKLVQFLGEFEYDLKTLFELFIDFKKKIEFNFQNNINSIFSEVNSIKKENISLKKIIKNNNKKKYRENSPTEINSRISKSYTNLNNAINNQKSINTKLNLDLKNPNLKQKLKEMFKTKNNKNKNKNKTSINRHMTMDNEINNRTNNNNNKEYYRAYIKRVQMQKPEEKKEKENLNVHPYQRKQNSNSEMNFYLNKSNTSNNITRSKFFYDYDTYLTNLKQNSIYNTNLNIIKYDNYLQKNNYNKNDLNDIARGNLVFDKDKKRKIMMEIFQNEKVLNELKKQFGNDIEKKLLNDDIDNNFFQKINEITNNIKEKKYYTPKIKNNYDNINDIKDNTNYNFKIPKRFSNHKNKNEKSIYNKIN